MIVILLIGQVLLLTSRYLMGTPKRTILDSLTTFFTQFPANPMVRSSPKSLTAEARLNVAKVVV